MVWIDGCRLGGKAGPAIEFVPPLRPHPDLWAGFAAGWRRLGADMVMLYPVYRLSGLDQQIEAHRRFKDALEA
jgi:hypothetical protein